MLQAASGVSGSKGMSACNLDRCSQISLFRGCAVYLSTRDVLDYISTCLAIMY